MSDTNLACMALSETLIVIAIVMALGMSPGAQSLHHTRSLPEILQFSVPHSGSAFDQGQSVNVSDNLSGGTEPYSYEWLVETPGSASYSLAPQLICSPNSANDVYPPDNGALLTETCAFPTNSVTQTGVYSLMFNLTDSSTSPEHYSNRFNVTLNPSPAITLSAASGPIAMGEPETLTASVSGGTGPFAVNILYQNGTVAYGTVAQYNGIVTYNVILPAPGNYAFQANAVDTGTVHQFAFNSVPVPVSVASSLTDANVLVTESSNVIDVPQNVLLKASVDSGAGPYGYSWSLNGNSVGMNSSTLILYANASTLGGDSVSVEVTDGPGQNAVGRNSVSVNGELNDSGVSVIVPQNVLYVGGNEVVTAQVTGGTPPYSYSGWSIDGAYALADTSNAITIHGNNTDLGYYNYISVNVTDAAGERAAGANVFNISIMPDVYLTASPNSIDEGQNTMLTEYINGTSFGEETAPAGSATAGGQLSPYTVSFYDPATNTLIATAPANAFFSDYGINFIASTAYTPQGSGVSPVNAVVTYTYSNSVYQVSENALMVYGPLSVNVAPSSGSVGQDGSATYSAHVSGGSGNFVYQWYNYSGASPVPIQGQVSRNITLSGGAAGSFVYLVQVTDVGVAPNAVAYSGNAALSVIPPTTTAMVLGSGGTGVAIGRSQKPTVKHEKSCYSVINFTQDNQETLTLNGTSFNIVENFITPTSAGISVNGKAYTINGGASISVGSASGYNYTLQLQGISYLPIRQTIGVSLCSAQATKAPPKNQPVNGSSQSGAAATVTLDISANGTITAIGQPGQTVQIIANGNVVVAGNGTAVYDGYGLMPGVYSVVGKDPHTLVDSEAKTFIRPRNVAVLELTGTCSNSTSSAGDSCTVTGTIYSNGSMLNASMYVNGNYLGSTLSSMNDTEKSPGNYMYVLSTAGNAEYAPETITYNYTLGGPTQGPAPQSVVAVIAAIGSSVTVTALLRYGHR